MLDLYLNQYYRRNELKKRRLYDQQIREVEHGSFALLIFSTSGGLRPTANVVYKRIALMIAEKYHKDYSKTLHWMRCKLGYSLLRSAITCLRGSRSTIHKPAVSIDNIDIACHESQFPY